MSVLYYYLKRYNESRQTLNRNGRTDSERSLLCNVTFLANVLDNNKIEMHSQQQLKYKISSIF